MYVEGSQEVNKIHIEEQVEMRITLYMPRCECSLCFFFFFLVCQITATWRHLKGCRIFSDLLSSKIKKS